MFVILTKVSVRKLRMSVRKFGMCILKLRMSVRKLGTEISLR